MKVLPYGVLVDHGFELLEVYNGKTFPKFIVPEETVVVVEVQNTTGIENICICLRISVPWIK